MTARRAAGHGKGEHQLADRMVEAAEQAGVPLYPDPELAMILSQIPSATKSRTTCTRRSPR
ncbi:MAG: hypothetical protein H6962_05710 [Chromatiaceae bacterium]|nr:hypothetical protein [Chromatiaceae bacterium]